MNDRFRQRVPRARRAAIVAALMIVAAVAVLLPGIATGAPTKGPRGLGEFLWGLAGQESGWDYTARNPRSGAYGRYQIMPSNWPSWAGTYLDDPWADQTPRNQELVARPKIIDLHEWLGSWRRVAYWWLTGDTETDEDRWSDLARGYVRNVIALARRAPKGGVPIPTGPAGAAALAQRGDWRLANHGTVLYDRMWGGRAVVAKVRGGEVLFIQGARQNSHDVLWMRASTGDGEVGWLSIRLTLPASRPPHSDRWPRGKGGVDTADQRRRERARPRPH